MATVQGDIGNATPSRPVVLAEELEVIGDYEIHGKLGQGGMGAVYRARQISLDRMVALKILPADLEEDANFVARFQREAAVAASLNHANLVHVYTSGVANGSHFIAMELIEGENLRQRLKRRALSMTEALGICLEVARGLQAAWQRAQLIHRDVKPSNIYLSGAGGVKLGDLGLAKSLLSNTTGLTHTGAAIGTPHYISPEQARGDKTIDLRADIYSLGCTLYELLTGATPYRGTDPLSVMMMHVNSPPPAIMKVLPQCPIPLGRLVNKMLRKARHERHQTYEELIAAMEAVLEQLEHGPAEAGPSALVAAWKEIGAVEQRGVMFRETTPAPQAAPAAAPRKPPAGWPVRRKSGLRIVLASGALVLAGAVALTFAFRPKPVPLTQAQLHRAQLAAEATARATIANATRDNPYVNSLGMKFVPVPITGGPPDEQRVLFSVWETRVQDYETFVQETKRVWRKPSFEQGPTHPAVNVSWDDAQAFCAWLTDQAHKLSQIGVDEAYRLPSDHEWSCAAGTGNREDPAQMPYTKGHQLTDVFPWGRTWPPPIGTGNFAGEEVESEVEAGLEPYLKDFIHGYRDDYARTAPVGSFHPNSNGLLDVEGNAGEWCEDTGEMGNHVVRGASWRSGDRTTLAASFRAFYDHGGGSTVGFRVVLAPASAPTPPSPATGSQVARAQKAPSPPAWRDLLADSRAWFSASGATIAGGQMILPPKSGSRLSEDISEGAIRAATTFSEKGPHVQLWAGAVEPAGARYELNVAKRDAAHLQRRQGDHYTHLASFTISPPLQEGRDYELEHQVTGPLIIAKINDTVIGEFREEVIPHGRFGVNNFGSEPIVVKSLRFSSVAVPTPATATKDAPFINSLGMKFVPVPITGGPTGEQRVLFSIWETRVQDYEAYSRESRHGTPSVGFEQGPTHPMVAVSWEDAQAFCKWLTDHERKTGRLAADEAYRLPSDHEWSCAVGIGDREDPALTPEEKNGKNPDIYPWGSGWPPPPGAGNYGGEEIVGHTAFAWQKPIYGYRDEFTKTAPVGSFTANAFGLFDLGGNAAEWCDDWFDAAQAQRVIRGGSFADSTSFSMFASARKSDSPGKGKSATFGFRVVLAPAAVVLITTPTPGAK